MEIPRGTGVCAPRMGAPALPPRGADMLQRVHALVLLELLAACRGLTLCPALPPVQRRAGPRPASCRLCYAETWLRHHAHMQRSHAWWLLQGCMRIHRPVLSGPLSGRHRRAATAALRPPPRDTRPARAGCGRGLSPAPPASAHCQRRCARQQPVRLTLLCRPPRSCSVTSSGNTLASCVHLQSCVPVHLGSAVVVRCCGTVPRRGISARSHLAARDRGGSCRSRGTLL